MNTKQWLPKLGVALAVLFLAISSVTLVRAESVCEPDPINQYIEQAILKRKNGAYKVDPQLAHEIACAIEEACIKYDLPPELVLAVMETESAFRPEARSKMNARGLMQVMAKAPNGKMVWLTRLKQEGIIQKEKELHEVRKGVMAGCFVLRFYIDEYDGNLKKALYAYVGAQSSKYRISVTEKKERFAVLIQNERDYFAQKREEERELAWNNLEEVCVLRASWSPTQD